MQQASRFNYTHRKKQQGNSPPLLILSTLRSFANLAMASSLALEVTILSFPVFKFPGYGFAGGSSFLTTGIYSEPCEIEKPKLESKHSSQSTSPTSSIATPNRLSSFFSENYSPKVPSKDPIDPSTAEELLPEKPKYHHMSNRSLPTNLSTESMAIPPKPRRFHVEQEKCLRCKKSVYAAEMVRRGLG